MADKGERTGYMREQCTVGRLQVASTKTTARKVREQISEARISEFSLYSVEFKQYVRKYIPLREGKICVYVCRC